MTFFVIPPAAPTVLAVSTGGLFPVRRVFCVGQNYADHAREMGHDPNRENPVFFTKPADAINSLTEVPFPPATSNLHYESELVVAVGTGGADIPAEQGLAHVYGYTVGCDLTRRDLQSEARKAGRPWDMAKGFDLSGVCATLRPAAEIGHPTSGAITLSVNGEAKQNGNLNQMIWSVPEVIAALSKLVTLAPGDLIFTGTPAGVGPLVKGDKVEMAVAGIASFAFSLV
jgi:fumarylpyruvate hydrolase